MPKMVTDNKIRALQINLGGTIIFIGTRIKFQGTTKIFGGATKKFMGNLKVCGQPKKFAGNQRSLRAVTKIFGAAR